MVAMAASLAGWLRLRREASIPESELAQLLRAYQVVVIADGLGGFEHNAALLVIDAQGRLLRIFDYTETDMALAYARSIAIAADAR